MSAEEVGTALGSGFALGLAGRTAAGAVLMEAAAPVGLVLLGAQLGVESGKLIAFAQECGKAKTQNGLDAAARYFGKWMGELSKEGALLGLGAAGGVAGSVAPEELSKARRIISSSYKGITSSIKESVFEPRFVTPEGFEMPVPKPVKTSGDSAVERATAKPAQTADDLNQKIVTVDSNGNPSGTRFRNDYDTHIKNREFSKASQKTGVNGAHDMSELEQYSIAVNPVLTKDSINIISKTPHPTIKGIYRIEYQMPKLDRMQIPTGGWRSNTFVKTVYDSSVISDKQMLQWGREAFAEAFAAGRVGSREWTGFTPNGIKIHGYVDEKGTNAIRSFFVEF